MSLFEFESCNTQLHHPTRLTTCLTLIFKHSIVPDLSNRKRFRNGVSSNRATKKILLLPFSRASIPRSPHAYDCVNFPSSLQRPRALAFNPPMPKKGKVRGAEPGPMDESNAAENADNSTSSSQRLSNHSSTDSLKRDDILWKTIVFPALVFAGIQLAWAVQIGHFTAHLRKLGLAHRYVGLAWLGGPLSGIIVQPIVGLLSDRCNSRFGKRRPFMVFGVICVALSLVLFAWAGEIVQLINPSNKGGQNPRGGLILALVSFWIVSITLNVGSWRNQ